MDGSTSGLSSFKLLFASAMPLSPPARALLRSQAGPHAGAWLTAIPSEPGLMMPPPLVHIALRRRLRAPLPVTAARCGGAPSQHGCGGPLDRFGDHALACPRSGLLARRAHVLEHAWLRVAREGVGPEGRVVPQPRLASTTLGVPADDQRRLDLLIHGATTRGEALACDVILVSPLGRAGNPVHQASHVDGGAVAAALPRTRGRRAPAPAGPRGRARRPVAPGQHRTSAHADGAATAAGPSLPPRDCRRGVPTAGGACLAQRPSVRQPPRPWRRTGSPQPSPEPHPLPWRTYWRPPPQRALAASPCVRPPRP